MKSLKNLLLSLLSLAIILALAEGALQVADYPPTPEIGWRWNQSPYRAAINQNDHQTNQLELRGSRIEYGDDDFVVVLLGDSQVEAGTQPADRLPEILLRQALKEKSGLQNIKVFSIASAGWGNDQQLVSLKKYFESYRADLVVNWLTPVNDYWENTFIDRSVTREAGRLKPTFRIDATNTLEPAMPAILNWKLKNLVGFAIGRFHNGGKYTLEQYYLDTWQKVLPSPLSETVNKNDCPALEIDQKTLIGSYMEGRRAYTLLTDEDVPNSRSHFTPFLRQSSPRDSYAIRLTHRLLQEAAATAEGHGARFFLFHTYRHDLDAAFKEIKCIKSPDGRHFPFDGSDWMRFLKASPLASRLLTAEIAADHTLSAGPNDWHFNEEGNRRAMEALAAEILKKTSADRSSRLAR